MATFCRASDNYDITAKVQRFKGMLGRFEQAINEMRYGSAVLGFVRDDGKRCLVYEKGKTLSEEIRETELAEFIGDLQSFFPTDICRQSSCVIDASYAI